MTPRVNPYAIMLFIWIIPLIWFSTPSKDPAPVCWPEQGRFPFLIREEIPKKKKPPCLFPGRWYNHFGPNRLEGPFHGEICCLYGDFRFERGRGGMIRVAGHTRSTGSRVFPEDAARELFVNCCGYQHFMTKDFSIQRPGGRPDYQIL